MKKKGFNSVLILIAILVWLFVFKKTFNFFDSNDTDVKPTNSAEVAHITALEFRKDTFEVYNYDRDPFLDTYNKKKIVVTKKKGTPKKAVKKPEKKKEISKLTWPKLQYFGYIKGGDEKRKLALIKIDNKLHRAREKQSINEIYVKTVLKDSVILKMNKETKTIKK